MSMGKDEWHDSNSGVLTTILSPWSKDMLQRLVMAAQGGNLQTLSASMEAATSVLTQEVELDMDEQPIAVDLISDDGQETLGKPHS